MNLSLPINKIYSFSDIKNSVNSIIGHYSNILPSGKDARVLLKPNLNANMNALTGNTTDLRIISALIECLKSRGYDNITIGEGTNSGYYRNNISVISRLKVDKLTEHYGVKVIDLNYSKPVYIDFENGVKAGIAKEVMEADLLINMPKLKTHFEAGMSVCLKNLMGCLVGQENKKKTHKNLAGNILNINKIIKPHLHIVDGIIAMEGLGPTRGTPLKTGMIFAGTDPHLIDLMCAKFASFDYRKVTTLAEAEKRGIINKQHHSFVNSFEFERVFKFKPPKAGFLASFIHSPKRQRYFLAVRNTPFFNFVCSTKTGGKILYATGLRQDVFIEDEMEFNGLFVDKEKCTNCGKCTDYCPVDIKLPDSIPEDLDKCIQCLYCFCICPEKAIELKGRLGFMQEQLEQYDEIIRRMA